MGPLRVSLGLPLAVGLGLIALASGCGTTTNDGRAGTGGESGTGGAGAGTGGTGAEAGVSVTYVKASNTGAGDFFGASAALSGDGNTLVVGAPLESSASTSVDGNQADDSAEGAGAVYVYERTGDAWSQTAYLKASNAGAGDAFGNTVALSADGSTLAVGAPFEASGATGVGGDGTDDSAPGAGAVYVFVQSGETWLEQAYLKASNSDWDDAFGIALALSADGSLLAVGAEAEDGASTGIDGDEGDKSGYESGAVFVFARTGTSWEKRAYIKASNAGAFDGFGTSVALSADGALLAVGAYREDSSATGIGGDQDDEGAPSAGAVYVFGHDGSAWEQTAYVKAGPSDGGASDNFGCAVSLSDDGTLLAVGAVGDPSASTGVNGERTDGSMPYAGAAYVFEHDGSSWQERAYLKASNTGAGDEFGHHLRLSGDGTTLVIGAALEASVSPASPAENAAAEAGAAYVFERDGSAFMQTAFLKAPNAGTGDRFGWAIASSQDGETLAIGATRESSMATGIDGERTDDAAPLAGAVYVYGR